MTKQFRKSALLKIGSSSNSPSRSTLTPRLHITAIVHALMGWWLYPNVHVTETSHRSGAVQTLHRSICSILPPKHLYQGWGEVHSISADALTNSSLASLDPLRPSADLELDTRHFDVDLYETRKTPTRQSLSTEPCLFLAGIRNYLSRHIIAYCPYIQYSCTRHMLPTWLMGIAKVISICSQNTVLSWRWHSTQPDYLKAYHH